MATDKQVKMNYCALGAVLLAFFAFFMSALVNRTVFERLPHLEDELAYLYQAKIFAGGQIVIDQPVPRQAYWQPFVVDHNPSRNRFGKYTPGWPAVLAVGVLLGQTWFINAAFAMLTVALVYRLGSEIFNRDVGIIAAILTAFSPMALLLNASLMAHTSALFYATLFMFAYWRLSHGQRRLLWGAVAGMALGMLAASRPLTTVAIGLPFIVWSGVRLLYVFITQRRENLVASLIETLKPLLVLSAFTILLGLSIPAFNYAATGDRSQNLYELVWSYDRVGFGECCGRNGHTLFKAFLHTKFDLTLTAADTFGWQFEPITPEMADHLRTSADAWLARGYSFILLPFGVMVGLLAMRRYGKDDSRKLRFGLLLIWGLVALFWVWFPENLDREIAGSTVAEWLNTAPDIMTNPTFAWTWITLSSIWLLAPLAIWGRWQHMPQIPYTWLLLSVVLGIVLVQMLYWIGSQRYSTRYYYEALTAAALLSALPLAWLARRISRPLVIAGVLMLSIFSLYNYSTPRIMALYQFNGIDRTLLNGIEERRVDDRPVLVLINGDTSGDNRVRWRAYAEFMAVTSPYLDSEIVGARNYGTTGMREQIVARFPDRQIIEVEAAGNEAWFADDNRNRE